MSRVRITPSSHNGKVHIPPSKSAAHRALICSYLAGGGSVSPLISSDDMRATAGVLEAIKNGERTLDCIESGSTLRFIIPVAAALGLDVKFTGSGRLPSRPLDEYIRLLPQHGVEVRTEGGLPFEISGKLKNGTYEVAGDVSSQYITGLLLALPLLDGDSAVILTTELQSKPYVDMTIKVMSTFGVEVRETEFGYLVHGNQAYKPIDYTVEGDWSQAAFFLVAGALTGDVTVEGLLQDTAQGDRAILDVLASFKAELSISDGAVSVKKSTLHGTEIDASDIPDLVPIIAVAAAFAKGETVIKGAERLRYKESDRLESVCENLRRLGIEVEEKPDGMRIVGGRAHGAELKGYNDHRIVMAFSVAALLADGEVVIDDAESINKSYPSFFEDFKSLGGRADVIGNR